MHDGAVCEATSDVKLTWASVMNNGPLAKHQWRKKREFPTVSALMAGKDPCYDATHDVVIRRDCPDELREMREWLDENARRGYAMFGRFKWTDTGFAVSRVLDGLLFRFKDPNVAFFFKMRWYNAPVAFG
jgi:hypothetical protein